MKHMALDIKYGGRGADARAAPRARGQAEARGAGGGGGILARAAGVSLLLYKNINSVSPQSGVSYTSQEVADIALGA